MQISYAIDKLWSWLETWLDEGGVHGFVVHHHETSNASLKKNRDRLRYRIRFHKSNISKKLLKIEEDLR